MAKPRRRCYSLLQRHRHQERGSFGRFEVIEDYQAQSWSRPRRIVAKIEINRHGVNRRFDGIDFGFRNPFAAVWGVVDRDDIL
jgi:hypothetical protein